MCQPGPPRNALRSATRGLWPQAAMPPAPTCACSDIPTVALFPSASAHSCDSENFIPSSAAENSGAPGQQCTSHEFDRWPGEAMKTEENWARRPTNTPPVSRTCPCSCGTSRPGGAVAPAEQPDAPGCPIRSSFPFSTRTPTFSTLQHHHRRTAPNNVIFGVVFASLCTADRNQYDRSFLALQCSTQNTWLTAKAVDVDSSRIKINMA